MPLNSCTSDNGQYYMYTCNNGKSTLGTYLDNKCSQILSSYNYPQTCSSSGQSWQKVTCSILPPSSKSSTKSNIGAIVGGIVAGVVVIAACIFIYYKYSQSIVPKGPEVSETSQNPMVHRI